MNHCIKITSYLTLALCLLQIPAAHAEVTLGTHPTLILTRAHNAAFGNKQNLLTQQLIFSDKKEWNSMIESIHKFIASLVPSRNIIFFWRTSTEQKYKKILEASMIRLERVNNELLNTLAVSYGYIARALPAAKKIGGTYELRDLNPHLVDVNYLYNLVLPLKAHKQVAIDVQQSMKKLSKTSNKNIDQAILAVETLALMLELTIDAALNSLDKIESFLSSSH